MRVVQIKDEELFSLGRVENTGEEPAIFLWQHSYTESHLKIFLSHNNLFESDNDIPDMSVKRRIEKLSLRLMAFCLLGNKAKIVHSASGRPYLLHSETEISISHSHGVYALSLSHLRHGIDVEQKSEKALRLVEKFLQPSETAWVNNPTEHTEKADRATLMWSAKEAVYKCADAEGLRLKEDICLSPTSSHAFTVLTKPNGKTFKVEYIFSPSFVLTCCTY